MMLNMMARKQGIDITPAARKGNKSVMSIDPDESFSTVSETSSHSDEDDDFSYNNNSNMHRPSYKEERRSFIGSFLLQPSETPQGGNSTSIPTIANMNNWNMMKRFQQASHSAKVQSHIATLKAGLTLWDREMKVLKESFGLECFEIMERNRNIGEISGGETDPEVVEVFIQTVQEMNALYDLRKRKLTQLAQDKGELPLCQESVKRGSGELPSTTTSTSTTTMSERLRLAQQSYLAYSAQSALKDDLKYVDGEIETLKQQFGILMFDTMFFAMGENWEPRDEGIQDLYRNVKQKISIPYQKRERANKEINDLESNGVILVTHEEVEDYITSHSTLYAMLSVITGLPEDECPAVAIRVAVELISQTPQGQASTTKKALLTHRQFQIFIKTMVENPKGAQEFFHRCIFAVYDKDCDGLLDESEVNQFLDSFYKSGPIFQGDSKLSQKGMFKELIWEQLEQDGRGTINGEFNFEELQQVTSGSTKCNRRRQQKNAINHRRDGSSSISPTSTTMVRPPSSWSVMANDLVVKRLSATLQTINNRRKEEEEEPEEESDTTTDGTVKQEIEDAESIIFLYEKERKY